MPTIPPISEERYAYFSSSGLASACEFGYIRQVAKAVNHVTKLT